MIGGCRGIIRQTAFCEGAAVEHTDSTDRLAEAGEQFNRSEGRKDGAKVASRLSDGLTILRESLYLRIHEDVEKHIGRDSMLSPVSEIKAQRLVITEIEIYQAVESTIGAKQAGYVKRAEDWYLPWLLWFRLGERGQSPEAKDRGNLYLSKGPDERRLAFMDVLAHALPESRKTPLVLFQLLPLAVRIATAIAFGDQVAAQGLRKEQAAILPAVADCRQCRGQVLDSAEQCRTCGNPLWKFQWLTMAD
jgi:hypothetical protein